jgi:hypothetical protein
MWPAEKSRDTDPVSAEQSVLCGPVCPGIIAKNGHVSRVSGERAAYFLYSSDCVAERIRIRAVGTTLVLLPASLVGVSDVSVCDR